MRAKCVGVGGREENCEEGWSSEQRIDCCVGVSVGDIEWVVGVNDVA